ncbi:MAG: DUF4855 domain-containing protein, partial [Erysipelotrichaceae bacterium]|nr:DUF4855 domain-containing protein [Erysipelotrichaceae bacterium]
TPSSKDPSFFHIAYGHGRNIDIDLGNIMAINAIKAEFLCDLANNIRVPSTYTIQVSTDGETFVSVAGKESKMFMNNNKQLYQLEETLSYFVLARYVRLSFQNQANLDYGKKVYISEIEIYGKKNTSEAKNASYDESIVFGNYPNPDTYNVNNMLFSFVYEDHRLDENNVMPLLSYMGQNGNIIDSFFDTFIVCASSSKVATSLDAKENITLRASEIFIDNYNLAAIEKGQEIVNKALNSNDKINIFLGLDFSYSNDLCSDVDNDGLNEDLSTSEDLADFLIYQVDYLTNLFNEKQYKNIELRGFYWPEEYFDETKIDEQLIAMQEMNEHIHNLNKLSFWCPFYGVDTSAYWYDASFDFACMQPNYMFNNVSENRLYATAYEALNYGMCVELELEDVVSDSSINKFYKYLEYGIKYGYMNSIKVSYHGSGAGSYYQAYLHNYELYKNVYLYSKNKLTLGFNSSYTLNKDSFIDREIIGSADSLFTLNIGDISKLHYKIKQSACYGDITINYDGTISYQALYNYQGYDYLILTLFDEQGNYKDIKITFKITK